MIFHKKIYSKCLDIPKNVLFLSSEFDFVLEIC